MLGEIFEAIERFDKDKNCNIFLRVKPCIGLKDIKEVDITYIFSEKLNWNNKKIKDNIEKIKFYFFNVRLNQDINGVIISNKEGKLSIDKKAEEDIMKRFSLKEVI